MDVKIVIANENYVQYAGVICDLILLSAQQRGTGIANRTPEYIADKMRQGKAVIAMDGDKAVGFAYIETWSHGMFVANSGLIVAHEYRKTGLAREIKKRVFDLSRKLYPKAKIFSITTGLAVMKINSELGYVPVTFSELTRDVEFWKGCEGCTNYDILQRNEYRMCLCTGLMFDPEKQRKSKPTVIVPKMLPVKFLFIRPAIFLKRLFQWICRKQKAESSQAESRRQKAVKQKAESRKQKAESRKQKAEGRRQKAG